MNIQDYTWKTEKDGGKPFINHINGIKTDYTLSNLEWCTADENKLHAEQNGLIKRYLYTLSQNENVVETFDRAISVANYLNVNIEAIYEAIRRNRKILQTTYYVFRQPLYNNSQIKNLK